jgi:cell division control protein 11
MSFAGRRGRNTAKKGVQFTIMVVGASGTGRTTFVNTLCETDVLQHKEPVDPASAHIEQGVKITTHEVGELIMLRGQYTKGNGELNCGF